MVSRRMNCIFGGSDHSVFGADGLVCGSVCGLFVITRLILGYRIFHNSSFLSQTDFQFPKLSKMMDKKRFKETFSADSITDFLIKILFTGKLDTVF